MDFQAIRATGKLHHDPIDAVITWVDGSDLAWQARMYQHYKDIEVHSEDADGSMCYRDWGLLRYVLRSIDAYAPWIRTIYIVTEGQIPEWINTKNPRLRIVRHEDFIPQQYLPTFSSHVIELNLHRIEGLSEQFIYFNDDTLLNAPVHRWDFFRKGKPVGRAIFTSVTPNETIACEAAFNDVRVINRNFSKKAFVKAHRNLLFHPSYGKQGVKNLTLLPHAQFTGFQTDHMPLPHLKSTFEEVWRIEPATLDTTCRHKFRNRCDVNQWVMLYWNIAKGHITPAPYKGFYWELSDDNEALYQAMKQKDVKFVCCNDSKTPLNFEKIRVELLDHWRLKLHKKCQYEKES